MNTQSDILVKKSKQLIQKLIELSSQNKATISDFKSNERKSILKLFDAQGVTSLLYYYLKDFSPSSIVPQDIYNELRDEYLTNAGRNIYIHRELDKVCEAFEEKSVPLVVIRGAYFSQQLYPTIGMRSLTDIDLIIFEKDLGLAQETLKRLGFYWEKEYPFSVYKDELTLDLHLHLAGFWRVATSRMSIDIRDKTVWSQTDSFNNKQYVRCLSLYDSILAASLHLQWHNFERLIWFYDIALLIERDNNFNWDFLLKRARERNLDKTLFYVLRFLTKHELINVPKDIMDKLKPKGLNSFERRTLKLLLDNERFNLSGELLFFYAIPNLKQKVKFLIDGVFLSGKYLSLGKKGSGFCGKIKRLTNIFKRTIRRLT